MHRRALAERPGPTLEPPERDAPKGYLDFATDLENAVGEFQELYRRFYRFTELLERAMDRHLARVRRRFPSGVPTPVAGLRSAEELAKTLKRYAARMETLCTRMPSAERRVQEDVRGLVAWAVQEQSDAHALTGARIHLVAAREGYASQLAAIRAFKARRGIGAGELPAQTLNLAYRRLEGVVVQWEKLLESVLVMWDESIRVVDGHKEAT